MPDPVSRKKSKKKILERWENEGGSIPEMPLKDVQSSPADKREDKGNAASASRSSTANKPKPRKSKSGSI